MGDNFKMPPFAVTGLAVQVADALRNAILTGYYAPGDVLPPIRKLASITGVSQVLVVRAIRILREERLITPRPHVGSVVCAKERPLWKGVVVVVMPSGAPVHYLGVVSATLREALSDDGYLALEATVSHRRTGAFDFSFLDTMLDRHVNLIVQLYDKPEVSRHLVRTKLPYIRFTRDMKRDPKGCVGSVRIRMDARVPDFVAHCRERGVRRLESRGQLPGRAVRHVFPPFGQFALWWLYEIGREKVPGGLSAGNADGGDAARVVAEQLDPRQV